MERYQPCPNCASEKAEPVGFTWWGGIVGPKIFNHVKCTQCGTTYNSKTGKSNQTAIAIYVTVWTIFGIVVIATFYPSRNSDRQTNPSTSSISSQDFDSPLETLRERIAILVPLAFAKRLEEKRLPVQRGFANAPSLMVDRSSSNFYSNNQSNI